MGLGELSRPSHVGSVAVRALASIADCLHLLAVADQAEGPASSIKTHYPACTVSKSLTGSRAFPNSKGYVGSMLGT